MSDTKEAFTDAECALQITADMARRFCVWLEDQFTKPVWHPEAQRWIFIRKLVDDNMLSGKAAHRTKDEVEANAPKPLVTIHFAYLPKHIQSHFNKVLWPTIKSRFKSVAQFARVLQHAHSSAPSYNKHLVHRSWIGREDELFAAHQDVYTIIRQSRKIRDVLLALTGVKTLEELLPTTFTEPEAQPEPEDNSECESGKLVEIIAAIRSFNERNKSLEMS